MMATCVSWHRSNLTPAAAAQWTLWTFVFANTAIVEILYFTNITDNDTTLSAAKFFGMQAALLTAFQLLLVARIPWLDRRLGMDRLTLWHRWVGFTLLWTVIFHATLIIFAYAEIGKMSIVETFCSLAGVPASLLGILAAFVMAVVSATSIRSLRQKLRYEVWHGLHLLLYIALGMSFIHQQTETTTLTFSTFAAAYWWTLWLLAMGALVIGRIILPLWRNAYHQFRVAAIVPESHDVVSVRVSGRYLERLPARPGQFFIWRFPGHNHWWQANPFSLSAAPDGSTLRLTAKAVGSASSGLRYLTVGTRAFLEGPYGALTSLHRSRQGLVLIAGGMGVTPIRALLEEASSGDVVVLYRVRAEHLAVLSDEMQYLVNTLGGRLHLLTSNTGQGARSFDPENIRTLVPDIVERDVYVCGPPAMTATVLNSLRELQVPSQQVHAEKFTLS